MANSTKAGRIDRRIQTPRLGIVNELMQVYREHQFDGGEAEMFSLERDSFRSALKKVDRKDHEQIKKLINKVSGEEVRIRGLGEGGALEMIAKLGIFMSANRRTLE